MDKNDHLAFTQAVIALSQRQPAESKNIYLPNMPLAFQAIGIKQDGFIISSKTLRKVMHKKHHVQLDALLQIPAQLSDPVAIIRPDQNASNPDGLIVLSNLTETEKDKEKPIVITLSFQDSDKGKVWISSIYGRRISQIQQGLNGDILYWNTEKGSELVNTFGLQLPTQLCSLQSLSAENIKTQHDLSQAQKDKNMDNSQTLHIPLDETPNSPFIQAIEQIEQGIVPKKDFIPVGNTPEVWQLVGMPDREVCITPKVIFKVTHDSLRQEAKEKLPFNAKNIHNLHAIEPNDLKNLPKLLNDPIAIFGSRKKDNAFLVLVEMTQKTEQGEWPVVSALHIKPKDRTAEIISIASVFDRRWENLEQDFKILQYVNTEKNRQFLEAVLLQSRTGLKIDDLSADIKTQHDLSQAQFTKDYTYLKENLGESARFITLSTTLPDGKPLLGEGVHLRGGREHGQTYINPERISALYNKDGDEILSRQERLLWVANHELFHRGFSVIGKEETERALEQAMTHPVVSELSDIIRVKRKTYAPHLPELTPYQACEEALSELYAMREAGNSQVILDRYNDLKTYPQLEKLLETAPLDNILNPHQQSQEQTANTLFKHDIQFDDQALSELLNRIGDLGKNHRIDYNKDTDWTEPDQYYSERIDDFGEHIAGAKKETYNTAELNDEEIQKLPLSKLWNEKDIEAIEDKTIAAIAHTLRDALPAKPRKTYKVRNWFDQLEKSKQVVNTLLEKNDPIYTNEILNRFDKAYLLSKIDRKDWKRIGDAIILNSVRSDFAPNEKHLLRIDIDKNNHNFKAASKDDFIPLITEKLEQTKNQQPKQNQLTRDSFSVYERYRDKSVFICAKTDRTKTPLVEFAKTSEAFAYLKDENNIEELNRLWIAHRELNSIGKGDMRNKENTERTGVKRREEDITPEKFMETFGIRGGQFGNWVKDEERQEMLNASYDGFIDMADALKISPKAIGLNGTLGIAFGARGNGNASAHYEPTQKVINLTKTRGAGSLAHEWFHALDLYLGKQTSNKFATESYYQTDNRYEEMRESISDLVSAFRNTELSARSFKADNHRAGRYFSTNVEMAARAFEGYIKDTLAKQGIRNDYLVNIQEEQNWTKNKAAYPYPTQNELEEFSRVYNKLFSELKKIDKLFEQTEFIEKVTKQTITEQQETKESAQEAPQQEAKEPKASEQETPKVEVKEAGQETKPPEQEIKETSPRERFRQETLKEIIEAVRNQNAPWQQSWRAGELQTPYNGYSNNVYQGGNALRLALTAYKKGYNDPRWLTYNQIKELGGSLRKGEKATSVIYYKQYEVENEETGEIEKKSGWGWHNVFNIEQSNLLEKHPEFKIDPTENRPNIDAIQKILNHHQPTIINGDPAYNPKLDLISMPEKSQFQNEASYYGTLLHELAHWTGHESRLDRDLTGQFGDSKYAHEEIIAELSKYMTCIEYGLPFNPTDAQSYLKSWAKQSNEDLEITISRAFSEAREASNLICAPLKEQRQEIHQENLKQNPIAKGELIYLNVPKEEKDQAKSLGAQWHKKEQKWYIHTSTNNINDFEKWLPEAYKQKITTTQKEAKAPEQKQTLDDIFNQQLQKVIEHKLGQDHIFQLGRPSDILLNTGFPDIPIELRASKLWEKSRADWHPFDIGAVKNLPSAIQNPIAVFAYGDKNKSQNIITEIEYNNKKFVVGVHFDQLQNGIEFNSVRGIFPKDNEKWLHWIEQGKALYLDKEKVQTLITQQRTNPADVSYLNLNSLEKIVQNFENVKHDLQKNSFEAQKQKITTVQQETPAPQNLKEHFYQTFYKAHDEHQIAQQLLAKKPTYLAIPYEAYQDRKEALSLGAKWNNDVKSWYIPTDVDATPLAKFLPQVEHNSHGKSLEDFKMAAERIGLNMRDFRENFNEWHRTSVNNKQNINKDGAYKLFQNQDGSIVGLARNLSTGVKITWVNKDQEASKLPKAQRNALELNQNTRTDCYIEARIQIAEQRAKDAQALWQSLPNATGNEPYLKNKHINEARNVKSLGQDIVLPLIDLSTHEIKSLQLIKADGSKQLMKQGQKTGSAIVIGDPNNLKQAENIILAEGFATADSALQIAKANGLQNTIAIAAVDAGNLLEVAKKINNINPQAQTLITADNDLATFYKHNKNPGLDAARAVQATFSYMKIIYPLSINNQNTDWNDALLKNGMNKSIQEFQNTLKLNHSRKIQQATQTVQQPTQVTQKNQETQKNEQQERPKSKKEHSK